ncbi:MAG: hypothetical protein L3J69_16420 [Desulfobacula sp.]|nr:hypothetical protein [Desulfobacula sp.]
MILFYSHQLGGYPSFYASDGTSVLRSGRDMRVALIGPGVSALHGYERTHALALKQTQNLIKAYIGL